jgi:NitT/TauT family transport system permease protein
LGFTRFAFVERSIMPFVVAFQAVPLIAIAPLLVLWFGNGAAGKIVMAAIICFFPAVINLTRGLRAVRPSAVMLLRSLSATPVQILRYVRIPSAVPYAFAALRISATLSVIGAIVAEISGATRGLGFRIVVSSYRTDTRMLFAALLFAVLLGLAFYAATSLLERSVQRRRPFTRVLD